MIKAIIFDMDGVLIDAKEWHYETLNSALEYYGFDAISLESHHNEFDGLSTSTKLEMLATKGKFDIAQKANVSAKKQELTHALFSERSALFDFQIELFEYLKSQNIKMAIASNSIRKTVEIFVRKSGVEKYIEFFLSNEDVSKPKPDSEIYNKAIKMLNFTQKEVLIVEDNINGIIAAKGSGANVLEVQLVADVNLQNIQPLL